MHGDAREDWSRSAALFEKALELDPGFGEALFHLATVRRRLGDEAGAGAADRAYLNARYARGPEARAPSARRRREVKGRVERGCAHVRCGRGLQRTIVQGIGVRTAVTSP
jgi:hypothetical protein